MFQLDLNPVKDFTTVFAPFWQEKKAEEPMREFTERLVVGVMNNLPEIDLAIKGSADNWHMDRMAVLDRNVMRMAVYEMLFCKDIPPVVSINEAVDIVKYFGSSESGRFVNGILDRIRKNIDRPARTEDVP